MSEVSSSDSSVGKRIELKSGDGFRVLIYTKRNSPQPERVEEVSSPEAVGEILKYVTRWPDFVFARVEKVSSKRSSLKP